MAISTYSELKTEIASFYNRTDLTSELDNFIDLCEAELQTEVKVLEFETDGTLTITGGVATLPSGWLGARSLVLQSNPKRVLRYITPDKLETINASSPAMVTYYTITGSQIKFADDGDGTLIATYMARFTPLSDSNTSNAILANFPNAYLFGCLKYAAIYCKDVPGVQGYGTLFQDAIDKINKNDKQRKYAGVTLEVRPG